MIVSEGHNKLDKDQTFWTKFDKFGLSYTISCRYNKTHERDGGFSVRKFDKDLSVPADAELLVVDADFVGASEDARSVVCDTTYEQQEKHVPPEFCN